VKNRLQTLLFQIQHLYRYVSVLQRHTKPGVPPLEWRVRMQMALGAAAGGAVQAEHAVDP
jgi:hypothetical protein